jgi:hypothetical protein
MNDNILMGTMQNPSIWTTTTSPNTLTPNTIMSNPSVITQTSTNTNMGAINNTRYNTDALLEKYELNQLYVEHRVSSQELLSLKDTDPDFMQHIKEKLTLECSKELVRKMSFTKKHDVDMDSHSYRGRVWVFTKEELVNMIEDLKGRV